MHWIKLMVNFMSFKATFIINYNLNLKNELSTISNLKYT